MAPLIRLSTSLIWFLFLSNTVVAKAIPQSVNSYTFPLLARQDGQLPKEACYSSCEVGGRCGGGICKIGSLAGRSDLFSRMVANVSDDDSSFSDNPLRKRTFRFSFDQGSTITAKKTPTKKQSLEYVVPILNSNDGGDTYFKPVLPLFHARGTDDADERAVSVFREFGNEPFQIGTNGLMGCSIVLLVSNEAVWMSHLWEAYSNGGDDSKSNNAFYERVVQFIKGEPVNNPSPSPIMDNEPHRLKEMKGKNPYKIYIQPTGPGIDGTKFPSARGQNTLLFIMAPTVRGATSNSAGLRYPNHVDSMKTAVNDQLTKRPGYKEVKYVTLDPDNVPGDEDKMFNSLRGTALFQYDPNSDGKGRRAWRLWLEGEYTEVQLR